ncbi:Stress response kinase A [Pseudomonas aeruginosa]
MSHPFDQLTPDLVLDAVESLGYLSDARVLALNSYENRVYQVGIEDGEPLIAKFYRPDRWSDAAIREEHAFSAELAECEVPVVAPLSRDGESLFAFSGFRFALFPGAAGARPSRAISTSSTASASCSAACTRSAPRGRSSTARRSLWITSATPRWPPCWKAISSPGACCRPTSRSPATC